MTTKPQGLDHSGAHGAEPTGSVVIFTDITEEALEPLAAAAAAPGTALSPGGVLLKRKNRPFTSYFQRIRFIKIPRYGGSSLVTKISRDRPKHRSYQAL